MFGALWDFFKSIFSKIVDPMFSAQIDGVSIFQWAFYVFLASLLVRFVLPLLSFTRAPSVVPAVLQKNKKSNNSED